MTRRTTYPLPRYGPARRATFAVAVTLAAACGFAPAQDQPSAPVPVSAPPDTRPSYPALERLNLECVSLYERLQGSVARVQVPAPANRAPDNAKDGPWNKYKVSPEVRQELERRAVEQQMLRNHVGQPAGQPANPSGGGVQRRRLPTDAPPAEPQQQPPSQVPAPPTNGEGHVDGSPQRPAIHPSQAQPAPARQGQNDGSAGSPAMTGSAPTPLPATNAEFPNAKQQHQQQQQFPQPQNGVTIVLPPQQSYGNNNYAEPQPSPGAQPSQWVLDNNVGVQRAAGLGNNVRPQPQSAGGFAPNAIGLLLNDRGHVLVPAYLDRDAVGDQPVRLAWGGGDDLAEARLVGADPQTQLSVLRLTAPADPAAVRKRPANPPPPAAADPAAPPLRPAAGRPANQPVRLSTRKLADGTLVLVLNPLDGVGRLTVWNAAAAAREPGVVVTINGEVAGIARAGQFLPGGACQLIADQIVRHGAVRRATLGVLISQVEPSDPARQQLPDLGDRPAVRVDHVVKGSAADRGGVRDGDLILTLAGEPVHDIPSLAAAIAARSGRTDLTVLRDGRVTPVAVDLVQR